MKPEEVSRMDHQHVQCERCGALFLVTVIVTVIDTGMRTSQRESQLQQKKISNQKVRVCLATLWPIVMEQKEFEGYFEAYRLY